jgi:hypothetical protein
MTAVGVIQSLFAAGACVLALAALRLSARWAQVLVVGALVVLGAWLLAHGVIHLQGGAALAGLMLIGAGYGLNAILLDIRRANAAALTPSGQAPGGAHAPGAAGKRDGERYAPRLPIGVSTTAGCAGRPRSFSEGGQ